MRNPFAAFKDPARRPRAIIWTGVIVIAFGALYAVSQMVTSTAWFCNDVCHNVHADNKTQYYTSSHAEVSCMACHYPVNMNPVSFVFDRVDKLLDIYPTIAGTFEMPVNAASHVALSTPDSQCTQCHNLANRVVTPRPGLLIDHAVHTESGVVCAACHNRVAHPEEGHEFTLPGNGPKADFMTMTACYRCHTLTGESVSEFKAPGQCSACHPGGFDLVPPSHDVAGWYALRGDSAGHASAAREETSKTAEALHEWAAHEEEFFGREARPLVRLAGVDESIKTKVPPPATINECYTCHIRAEFCDACHGTEVPHAADFIETHGEKFTRGKDAISCGKCHNKTGKVAYDDLTCTLCHHPNWDGEGVWRTRHPDTVQVSGADACFECHLPTYCSSCHVRGNPSTPY